MFKLIGIVCASLVEIVTSLTNAITPLSRSAQYASEALELHASELKADAEYECKLKAAERAAKLTENKEKLKKLKAA